MEILSKKFGNIQCNNEYDELHRVILCEPQFMTIRDVINETQEYYKHENININRAIQQHAQFCHLLNEHGIEVIKLSPSKQYPEQVFTRDIGFTIGQNIFTAEMAADIRQGEEHELKKWLESEQISYHALSEDSIEGGDVIVDGHNLYVGISSRTNKASIQELTRLLPGYEILPISLNQRYLHLDCVFNIISPEEALIFPQAIDQITVNMLSSRFDLIEVTEKEQFTLGTNVLSIGRKKVFSLMGNHDINNRLRERGYHVIEVDITEIIKSGGSFRCCTLPILRG
ncbi:dimethylarginine dimethylaminohydrolase family protein [Domibacillus sp. DTU_2020_1001157_1_SI_ALB_TIR_016]|uniref:dimethylarginine dimethylaminohydrolase family protein n=1 Tax=Domibacillus sp. DTU_2020_1001157_1_SI_ALB_TIR_016 TaxID=3077789 RepID=UPI0028E5FD28|nr:dimethylarginine dimethylaminohydrolase family protein [Domibacillus sp. DTU_2020_1001157_1_SI_ALB_TIR_016]WNS77852.1 dimethylarginine dimethylaminohydrolase family protein [Domibacillus sp. DTU_2020_1001157_1_SI_ALB_TIR_016]